MRVQTTGRLETHAALLALCEGCVALNTHAKYILANHLVALHVMLTGLHNLCIVMKSKNADVDVGIHRDNTVCMN